jgi:hypothetical protein
MPGSPKPESMLLFGRIARKHRFVLPEDLEECLAMAEKLRLMGLAKKIGEILSDQGYLSEDHVQWILQRQSLPQPLPPEDSLFGDLAVLNSFVLPGAVERALREQQKDAKRGDARRIGEILVAENSMRTVDRDAIVYLQQRLRTGAGLRTGSGEGTAPSFLLLEASAPRPKRAVFAVFVAAALFLALAAGAAALFFLGR